MKTRGEREHPDVQTQAAQTCLCRELITVTPGLFGQCGQDCVAGEQPSSLEVLSSRPRGRRGLCPLMLVANPCFKRNLYSGIQIHLLPSTRMQGQEETQQLSLQHTELTG